MMKSIDNYVGKGHVSLNGANSSRGKIIGYMSALALLLLSACNGTGTASASPIGPDPTKTETPVVEVTESVTPSATPTPTLEPNGDPDGDGYRNSWEEAWGTSPVEFTSFEELKELPDVITGILHTKKPYEIEDMNLTIYQQVKLISEESIVENNKDWETLSVEFVLFPNVTSVLDGYVKSLGFPYSIPNELEEYLKPYLGTDTCDLEEDMMSTIINKSDTLFQLLVGSSQWNHQNLDQDIYGLINGYILEKGVVDNFATLSKISSCFMMESGKIGLSTNVANKSVSDFREAGIPSGIAFSFDPTDVSTDTLTKLDDWRCVFVHPQTTIWTPDYGWIVYDYNGIIAGARQEPFYTPLMFTDIAPDFSLMEISPWVDYSDWIDSRTYSRPNWLFFSENVNAPGILSDTIHPFKTNPCE